MIIAVGIAFLLVRLAKSDRTQINAHYGRNAINNKQKKYLIKDPGANEMFYVMPDLDNVDGTAK